MGCGQRANRSADAASEVMGHTLLVAAIALFAFGMAAGFTRTVAIAVSAHQEGDDIVLTYMGGKDNPSLSSPSTSPAPRRTHPDHRLLHRHAADRRRDAHDPGCREPRQRPIGRRRTARRRLEAGRPRCGRLTLLRLRWRLGIRRHDDRHQDTREEKARDEKDPCPLTPPRRVRRKERLKKT